MVIQRLVFGFGLHDAPHIGDLRENKPKRGTSQLLIVLDFFFFVVCVDFVSPNKPLSGGGSIAKSVCLIFRSSGVTLFNFSFFGGSIVKSVVCLIFHSSGLTLFNFSNFSDLPPLAFDPRAAATTDSPCADVLPGPNPRDGACIDFSLTS